MLFNSRIIIDVNDGFVIFVKPLLHGPIWLIQMIGQFLLIQLDWSELIIEIIQRQNNTSQNNTRQNKEMNLMVDEHSEWR